MPKQFNIEEQYQRYLKMVKLSEEQMPEDQKVEMRRAFYGGIGQMTIWMFTDMDQMTEPDAMLALDSIRKETLEFWKEQAVDITSRG